LAWLSVDSRVHANIVDFARRGLSWRLMLLLFFVCLNAEPGEINYFPPVAFLPLPEGRHYWFSQKNIRSWFPSWAQVAQ